MIELLAQLIAIDSSNPDLGGEGAGEGPIADVAAHWLAARGAEITRLEATPGRPSIVATWPGTGGGRSLMLNGHLDTVTLASYDGDALAPVIGEGNIYGRGSYDMKSGIAAMMMAAATAAKNPHRGDIVVTLVADEEFGSAGTAEVLKHFSADGAIVVEPSELQVTLAHRGFAWFDVVITGRAAHGSRPDLGIDAIVKTGQFLTALEQLSTRLAGGPLHPILGPASVHASLIRGGEELSSYPATCTVSLEWRTIPGQDSGTVRAELDTILRAIADIDPDFSYQLVPGLSRQPFEAQRESAVVQTVLKHVAAVTHRPAIIRGEPFWTDCALLAEAGIPAVLFGVRGGGAHAAVEWAEIDSIHTVADVLRRTIDEFCA